MGSYCITQAVLEQAGREFKLIKGAELKELCGMVSLHFRKCCRAYNTIYSKDQCQDLNMMKWIFRWAALFERLKATQEKIDKIKSGKLKIETLLEKIKDEPLYPLVRLTALYGLRRSEALGLCWDCVNFFSSLDKTNFLLIVSISSCNCPHYVIL